MRAIHKTLLLCLLLMLCISAAHAQDEPQFAPGDWVLVTDWSISIYAQADPASTQVGELAAGWRTRIITTTEGEDGGLWLFMETGAYGWIKGTGGLVLYSDEVIEQFIADASDAIDENPDDLAAYVNRATAYISLNQYDAALSDFTYAIDNTVEEVDPIKARAWVYRGLVYLYMENYNAGIEDVLNGLGIGYGFPSTYSRFALGYELAGDYQAALDIHLDTIDRRASDWGLIYNNIGVLYNQLEDYDASLEYYAQALELAPQGFIYASRSYVYQDLGDENAQLSDMNTAISIDPFCSSCYRSRGMYYVEQGDDEAALEDLEQAVAVDPLNSIAWSDLGVIYNRFGDYETGADYLKIAADVDPYNIYAWYNLANSYGHLGRYDEALEAYNQADSLSDTLDTPIFLYRAQVQIALGDFESALSDINVFIEINRQSPADDFRMVGFLVRANVYLNLEDYDSAEEDFINAFDVFPELALQYYVYGYDYRLTITREDLIFDLLDEIDDNPDDADLYRQLGNLYMEFGLWQEGIDAFTTYQSMLDTPNDDLDELIETLEDLID